MIVDLLRKCKKKLRQIAIKNHQQVFAWDWNRLHLGEDPQLQEIDEFKRANRHPAEARIMFVTTPINFKQAALMSEVRNQLLEKYAPVEMNEKKVVAFGDHWCKKTFFPEVTLLALSEDIFPETKTIESLNVQEAIQCIQTLP